MNDEVEQNEAVIIRKVTWCGLAVNMLLAAVKISVGFIAQSQALIADGLHSFSDMSTDVAIIIGAGFWSEPADASHPYGHGRLETLINIGIGIALALTGIGIAWRAFTSMSTSSDSTQLEWSVLGIAVAAMFLKEFLYRRTLSIGEKISSRALKSNAWHHRSDALSSIPVALSVVCAHAFPQFHYFDNIAAMIVAAMIAKVSWEILRPSFGELLESGDAHLCERIKSLADKHGEIGEIHAIRSRRVGKAVLVDFHLLVAPEMSVDDAHAIAEKFKRFLLDSESDLTDVVIHIEPLNKP
jgi:cation diffusion facilitator family transporter